MYYYYLLFQPNLLRRKKWAWNPERRAFVVVNGSPSFSDLIFRTKRKVSKINSNNFSRDCPARRGTFVQLLKVSAKSGSGQTCQMVRLERRAVMYSRDRINGLHPSISWSILFLFYIWLHQFLLCTGVCVFTYKMRN